MDLKGAAAAGVLLLGSMTPVVAADCSALKGQVIYEDAFADDAGGWSSDPDASFGKPALTLTIRPPNTTWLFLNNTYNATQADYCVEAVLPGDVAWHDAASVGLSILYADPNNFVVLMLSSGGAISLWRKAGGNWTKVNDLSDPSLKLAPGAAVALRLTVRGDRVTPAVNGVALKPVRVQIPPGALSFGVYAQVERPVAPGAAFQFKAFRVTTVGE